jgi:hypothetical protein
MTARAEAGDDDAKEWLARDRYMELLRLAIRRRPKWRVQSRPRTEPIGEWGNSLEGMLNPSRVIAELQRRGLAKSRLRGWVRLTDAGREKVRAVLPTLNPKTQTQDATTPTRANTEFFEHRLPAASG